MIASTATDLIISTTTSLSAGIIVLAIAIGRIHARVVRLEEWIRRYEREEFHDEP
jgi:hypothetical protein